MVSLQMCIRDRDLAELRAAYYALVEEMDEQVGRVYDAFQTYLERSGKERCV